MLQYTKSVIDLIIVIATHFRSHEVHLGEYYLIKNHVLEM